MAESNYENIAPIRDSILPRKQAAKRHYGVHPYFTRRPWNVVQKYIDHFSRIGDTVLDPYGGSGVTAIEALVLRRKAIQMDLAPLANFICRSIAYSPVSIDALNDAFAYLEAQCASKISELYESYSNDDIDGADIPHWYPTGVSLPSNADEDYVEDLFTQRQLYGLSLIFHHIDEIEDGETREMMRFVFSGTLAKVNRTFVSAKGRAPSRGGSQIFSVYRYAVPSNPVELDPWSQFDMRFRRVIEAKKETNQLIGKFFKEPENFQTFQGSASSLTDMVGEHSVDYIFTDPPYGAHIAYLDLMAMWDAWLGFIVDEDMREQEAIEGGEKNKTSQEYFDSIEESIEEMFRVLKYDRWMSVVFAHKDPAYWDALVKSCQNAGFDYANTVVQPVRVVWSMHKKKNPLTVFSGELILNFRKVKNPKTIAISQVGSNAVQIIKNCAERSIVKNNGASTEMIYHDLIPELLENGLLGEVKEQVSDITPMLQEDFEYSEIDEQWHVRQDAKIGSFIPLNDRIRFYLTDYLAKCKRVGAKATFDDIIYNVMPKLINGEQPTNKSILNVLRDIAYTPDEKHWELRPAGADVTQPLDFSTSKVTLLPRLPTPMREQDITHNELIYRLAMMGLAADRYVWIGKKEQSEGFSDVSFSELSLDSFPFEELTEDQERKIAQIDVIWLNDDGEPEMAFEVEASTPFTTALDRFVYLLEAYPEVARSIAIISPSSRRRKLFQELSASTYIGHPFYMENKARYLFYPALIQTYDQLSLTKPKTDHTLDKLVIPAVKGVLEDPQLLDGE